MALLMNVLFILLLFLTVAAFLLATALAIKVKDSGKRARQSPENHTWFLKQFYAVVVIMVLLIEGMIQTKFPGLEGFLHVLTTPLGSFHATMDVLFIAASIHNALRDGFKSRWWHKLCGKFAIYDFFLISFTGGLLTIDLMVH